MSRKESAPADEMAVPLDLLLTTSATDHISPLQACYRSARLLGVGGTDELDPDEWAAAAELHSDSWWPDHAAWLVARGGEQKTAPKKLGTRGLPPLEPAPGIYVHER